MLFVYTLELFKLHYRHIKKSSRIKFPTAFLCVMYLIFFFILVLLSVFFR